MQSIDVGNQVFGNYRLVKEIADSPLGRSYLAEHTQRNRQVTLTIVAPANLQPVSVKNRLEQGLRRAAQIQHPNVVNLLNFGEERDTFFIHQEVFVGESIEQRLNQKGELTQLACVKLMRQACLALASAHKLGIVHGNLTPATLLVDEDSQLKIDQFWLDRSLPEIQGLHIFRDQPFFNAYSSPEFVSGYLLTASSDIYSLGACFFHMLTGRAPFSTATAMEMAKKHLDELPISPRAFNSKVSVSVANVVAKMLAKNAVDRYQNAKDVIKDLDRCVVDQSDDYLAKLQQSFKGKYLGLERLRETSLGPLFRAEQVDDRDAQRKVTILTLDPSVPSLAADEQQSLLTLSECQAHELVQILEVGTVGELRYQVLEDHQVGILSEEQLVKTDLQSVDRILDCLQVIHESGKAHGNLSPESICFDHDNEIKIAFTHTGHEPQNPHYMAPEQLAELLNLSSITENEDDRLPNFQSVVCSDIYSLGVLCYQLLTGELPFTGETFQDVARLHWAEMPVAPATLNPELDPSLSNIVLNMLAKQEQYRYQSVLEVKTDLELLKQGQRVEKRANVGLPFETGHSRSSFALAIYVILLLAALLALFYSI